MAARCGFLSFQWRKSGWQRRPYRTTKPLRFFTQALCSLVVLNLLEHLHALEIITTNDRCSQNQVSFLQAGPMYSVHCPTAASILRRIAHASYSKPLPLCQMQPLAHSIRVAVPDCLYHHFSLGLRPKIRNSGCQCQRRRLTWSHLLKRRLHRSVS